MTIRMLPAGDRAVLVEVADLDAALALAARLRAAVGAGELTAVEDLVPASRTVLIRVTTPDALGEVESWVWRSAGAGVPVGAERGGSEVVVPVRYDGPDLAAVAEQTGMTCAAVVAAHTGQRWRAAFAGFAPGFCYLTGGDPRLQVARRAESRPVVPGGSVALAGEYSAVYPRDSPGGWQLIGSTGLVLWDVGAEPPAVIQPGSWVRFVDVDAGSAT